MDKEEIIWNIFDEMRSTEKKDIANFTNLAKSKRLDIDLDILRFVDMKLGVSGGGYFVPEFVIKFIIKYLQDKSTEKLLDPWVKIGSLIIPLTEKLKPKKSVGFVPKNDKIEIIKILQKKLDITWEFEDIGNVLDENSAFDVIISFPPWNLPSETVDFKSDDNKTISISDKAENIQLLRSLQHLKDDGIGIFILNKSFLLSKNKKNAVLTNLNKFGIYVDAALEIPAGSFSHTTVSGDLVIFKKEDISNIFIGELSIETISNNSFFKNLESHKNGKIPQLGILKSLEDYKPLNYFIREDEINKIASTSGLTKTPLLEVLNDVNLPKNGKDFKEAPNTVYLPTIGMSDAVISPDQFNIKPQNYIQLVFDPEKANANFVAGLYNTKLGEKIRESLFSGSVIPKINKSTILDSHFYLTDIETQNDTVHVDSMLKEIYIQLDNYQNQLWKWPKANKRILKSVELLNVGRKFDYWMESLPYPLSSILSACKSDNNVEHKVNYLLDFFEAFSLFNSTVILSCITSDKDFYNENFEHCFPSEDNNNWLYRTSFTNWNILGFCLAKKVRKLLSNNETRVLCMRLFGNPSKDFIDLVTSPELYNIFKEVEDCRNSWKGHGSTVDKEETVNRLKKLDGYLSEIRRKVAFIYDDVTLFFRLSSNIDSPDMDFDDGIYYTWVKEIKGKLPFESVRVETLNPLEKKKIYLIHENQYESIELLPFIRIMPGPKTEQDACYFYNRYNSKDGEVRFLSYHFEKESEVKLIDKQYQSVISTIEPQRKI